MISGLLLVALFIVGGLWLSGSLFSPRRFLTWIASSCMSAWGFFLLGTFISRHWSLSGNSSLLVLYGVVTFIFVLAFFLRHNFTWPLAHQPNKGMADLFVLVALIPMLGLSSLISSFNGEAPDHSWVTYGFNNGDTVTFVSLVQKSLLTSSLVHVNPFASGASLEYPSLVHGAVATLFTLFNQSFNWIYFLPTMVFVGVFITVPMFFLLIDSFFPEPTSPHESWFGIKRRWIVYGVQALTALYTIGYGFDNFVYPQSHFFLFSIFLGLATLIFSLPRTSGLLLYVRIFVAAVLAFVLLLSNAVIGTIAAALFILFALWQAGSKQLTPRARGLYLILALIFLGLFFTLSSGEANFGKPHFPYAAVQDILRFAPVVFLLAAAIFWQGAPPFVALSVTTLISLGFFVFIFSRRAIIVDNSPRFIYHAFLLGFPFVTGLIIRAWFWMRRELFYTTRPGLEKIAPFFLIGCGLLMFIFPPLLSVASTLDSLTRQDKQVVTTPMREGLWWVADHASPEATVIASPYAPWAVPFFTGRSLLRAAYEDGSAYWLSPKDGILEQQIAAFKGDKQAQAEILKRGDYLMLTADQRTQWEPVQYKNVFDTKAIVVYQLK